MNNSFNGSDNCFPSSAHTVYRAYAVVNIVMGFVASALGATVLMVLFLLDKHLFYYQRLIIYLNIAVIFGGVVSMISVNPFLSDGDGAPTKSTFCTINAILFNWSTDSQHLIIWWVSIEVFRLGLSRTSLATNRLITKIEVVLILVTFFLPPLLLWIPAIPSVNQYGPDGPVCDIERFDYSSCERSISGYILVAIYKFIPWTVLLILLPILLIINACRIQKDFRRIRGSNCQHQREIVNIRQTALQLLVFPFLYIAFSVVPALYYIVDSTLENTSANKSTRYVLVFLNLLIRNFRGISVSLGFAFDKDTRSRLRIAGLLFSFRKLVGKEKSIVPYSQYNESNLYTSYGDSLDAKEMRAILRNTIN